MDPLEDIIIALQRIIPRAPSTCRTASGRSTSRCRRARRPARNSTASIRRTSRPRSRTTWSNFGWEDVSYLYRVVATYVVGDTTTYAAPAVGYPHLNADA